MTRALTSNAEMSFEMIPDLTLDAETNAILDDTEQLLEIRRANMNQDEKKVSNKTRSSSRLARKLRFSKDVSVEDMDTSN
jgi:hypothetical protein